MLNSPAAGTDWTVTVPGGRQWRVLAGVGLFIASAAVATRLLSLRLSDGNATWWQGSFPTAPTAGQQFLIGYGLGVTTAAAPGPGSATELALPAMWLPPLTVLFSATAGIQAGDLWGNLSLMIEECWVDDQYLSQRDMEYHGKHPQHQQRHFEHLGDL